MIEHFSSASTIVYLTLCSIAVVKEPKYYIKQRQILFCSWFTMMYFYLFTFVLGWHGVIVFINLIAIVGNIAEYSLVKKLEETWK